MANRLTRVPERPVPQLPRAARVLVPLADLFMLLMISRAASGSLRRTWVTPATLWLGAAAFLVAIPLVVRMVEGGVAALLTAVVVVLGLGPGAVAAVGMAQRWSLARVP